MNLEPRKRFAENAAWRKCHQDLVDSVQFRASLEAALAHMILSIGDAKTPEEASAAWRQVEGARAFIRTIMNLAENPEVPPRPPNQNLNHNLNASSTSRTATASPNSNGPAK